jgi:AcrR family transcriptional regulator
VFTRPPGEVSWLGKFDRAAACVNSKESKSAEDWIEAGLALLSQQGVEAVKVERLAIALGVTKGSFYWHFRDRAALLSAMLARWQAVSTAAMIERIDAVGGSAASRLATLIEATSQSKRAARVEQAIRAWGARDKQARAVLAAVDSHREAYVQRMLQEHGLSEAHAKARAHPVPGPDRRVCVGLAWRHRLGCRAVA